MNGSTPNTRRHISCKEKAYLDNLVRGVYAKGAIPAGTKIDQCNFDEYFFLAVPLLKGQLSGRETIVSATLAKEIGAGEGLFISDISNADQALGFDATEILERGREADSASENQRRYQRKKPIWQKCICELRSAIEGVEMKASDYIASFFSSQGVDTAFVVTGGGAMHLNDAFAKSPDFSCYYFHHEQAAAMAAEGYARVTGRPCVLNVTSGPGALNSLTGIFGAYTDSVPVLVVSGQVKTETLVRNCNQGNLRQLGDQETQIIEVARPLTKWIGQPATADELPDLLKRMYRKLSRGGQDLHGSMFLSIFRRNLLTNLWHQPF